MECTICKKPLNGLVCDNEHCNQHYCECSLCHAVIPTFEAYEYRGAESCESCFESVQKSRETQRQEIIQEESSKTEKFRCLDLDSSNSVGKGNREIMSRQIEIASNESVKLKDYEGRL